MREIKFRAWHKRNKIMLNIIAINFSLKQITADIETRKIYPKLDYWWKETDMPFSEIELMQSTGLKDCNNNLIHEGDILQFTVFNAWGNDTQYTGVVKFESGGWEIWHKEQYEFYGDDGAFDLFWVHQQDDEIEVLGNIHDNPELLEENNE